MLEMDASAHLLEPRVAVAGLVGSVRAAGEAEAE
jgi:hypothetical protein